MFDEMDTLTLLDLRQLDEISFEILKLRNRVGKFISENPQLSWHDVDRICSIDQSLDFANTKVCTLTSILRTKVYSRVGEATMSFKADFEDEKKGGAF